MAPNYNAPSPVTAPSVLLWGLLLVGVALLQEAGSTSLPEQHSDGLDYPYADSYAQDWSSNWDITSGRHNQAKCIDIPSNLSLCRNIGYNQMRLPNLLDHDTVSEVVQQASSWVPLLGIRCHADTKLFLCSLFSPVCLDRPIWPCRSLCNSVRTSCIRFMNKYGFPWPDMLRCDKFPLDNDLCIGLQNEHKEAETEARDDRVCEPCNKPQTFESIVHNYCVSDFVLKMRVEENMLVNDDMKIVAHRRKKVMKKGSLRRRDLRTMEVYVDNGRSCDCPSITNSSNPGRAYFLVMGRMEGGRAMASFINPYDKRNKDTKKAMRAIKKTDICKSGITAITGESPSGVRGDETTAAAATVSRGPTVEVDNRGNRKRNRKQKNNRKKERGNGRQRNRNRNRDEQNSGRRNKRRNRNNQRA